MWHEARKQEKKIRGMMVDYKKRAERRREYYEKIKQDPAQFLQVHGRPCKIHLDPAVAQAADSPATMMPWQGHTDNMIDRFDVRAHLDIIPDYKPPEESPKLSAAEMLEDRQSNYERYRALVQNDFLGVSEDKFLHQIFLEERYGPLVKPNVEEEKKKLAEKKAAIGYVYEDSTPHASTAGAANIVDNDDPDEDEEEEKDEDLSDIDLDLAIEVDELTPGQCEEMNVQSLAYGMKEDDFIKFLYQDKEEAEQLRLARELEEEKAMYSGRKSRRERRALREKKLQGRRITSPPSYAARESPTYKPFHRSHSSSRSRSHSPVNAGQITYITSFGDEGSEEEMAGPKGPPPKPAIKPEKPPVAVPMPASKCTSTHQTVQEQHGAKVSERTSRSSPPPSRPRHRCSSRTRSRNQSSSDSRSSHSSHRDSRRRTSSYRHRSRHRSRSRSTSSRGRSRSSSPRSVSDSRSRSYHRRHHRTRSKSRSRSRSDSRSRSRSQTSKSRSRSHSWSKSHSHSQSERHHSRSRSPRLPTPPVRSYYRHSLSRSSSDPSSESEDEKNDRANANMQSGQSSSSTRSFPFLGKADPTAKKLTPQEKLKRKMQAALNRQYKADKRAQLQKIEKQQQEQQDRAEELREMAIKLRQRERERRHRMMEYDREHPSERSSYSSRHRSELAASMRGDDDDRPSRRRHQSFERRSRLSRSRSASKSASSTSSSDSRSRTRSRSRSHERSRSRERGRSRTPPSRRRHSDHRDHRRWGHRSRSRSPRSRNGNRLVVGY